MTTLISSTTNKYAKWYEDIIKKAKARTLVGYKENHHIIPRSLGGLDHSENIVKLTAREHFVCHWLLVKLHTGEARGKMINAMYMMQAEGTYQERYKSNITSRVYTHLREEYARYISMKNKGRKQPPEEKERQIKAITGRKRAPFSDEWKENLSKNHKSKRGYSCLLTNETKRKISEAMIGRKQNPEVVAKRSEKQRLMNMKREKKLCPHCNREVAINGYARWHGDNCKEKVVV